MEPPLVIEQESGSQRGETGYAPVLDRTMEQDGTDGTATRQGQTDLWKLDADASHASWEDRRQTARPMDSPATSRSDRPECDGTESNSWINSVQSEQEDRRIAVRPEGLYEQIDAQEQCPPKERRDSQEDPGPAESMPPRYPQP